MSSVPLQSMIRTDSSMILRFWIQKRLIDCQSTQAYWGMVELALQSREYDNGAGYSPKRGLSIHFQSCLGQIRRTQFFSLTYKMPRLENFLLNFVKKCVAGENISKLRNNRKSHFLREKHRNIARRFKKRSYYSNVLNTSYALNKSYAGPKT